MGSCRTAGASCVKTRVSIFRTYIRTSENRGHGNVATQWSIAVPCTPFSDGEVKSKYRNPGFGHSEAPAVRHEPIYLLFFSVTPWLRGAKVLSLVAASSRCVSKFMMLESLPTMNDSSETAIEFAGVDYRIGGRALIADLNLS